MIVNKPKKKRKPLSRFAIVKIVMIILFSLIVIRVMYLQVLKHNYYREKANENATRFIAEQAPRGEILDDKGNVLASNREIYNLTYTMPTTGETHFYKTMNVVFQILKQNNESLNDDMLLKLDKDGQLYYAYKSSSLETQEYEKLRFLKDRGMNEYEKKKMFGIQERDLSDTEKEKIDEALLKVTPMEAFEYLVKSYNLIELINKKPVETEKNPSKKQTEEFKEKLQKYNSEKEKYQNMTGAEILKILEQKYTIEEIRNYMVVKDAIKIQSFKGYRSVVIASNIDKKAAFTVYQKLNELPGINVELRPVRYYPYKNLASSVLGYVSPVDSSLKDEYELRGYDVSTDLVGKAGIEKVFEEQLKGTKGGKTVKVNADGRVTENLYEQESYPGNNLHLTINKNVQYAMQKALEDTINKIRTSKSNKGETFPNATRGAALLVDVNNGNIIAMASYPDYDPNIFAIPGQLTKEQIETYFNPNLEKFGSGVIKYPGVKKSLDQLFPKDKNGFREDKYDLYPKPFYNYATLGAIPPGSIFKPLTAIAALEEGVIGPNEKINATGKFNTHPDVFGKAFAPECWIYSNYGGSHGPTDVKKALQVSCNYFFYEMGYRLYEKALKTTKLTGDAARTYALDSLARWAWKFGLGYDPTSLNEKSTGIEIPENGNGQVYNFENYKSNSVAFSKFNLNDYLVSGDYQGIYKFAPFDFAENPGDTQELSDAKKALKEKITERLNLIGTGKPAADYSTFLKEIEPNVKNIMENSKAYKESFDKFKETHKDVTMDNQAKIVSTVITQFVVRDEQGEMLSPAQLVYASIGQGINHFTPIQLAGYITAIANGGTRYKLHLVDEITNQDGKVVEKYTPEVVSKLDLKPSTIQAVHEGMRRANDSEEGTAAATFSTFPIETAGKTGTADYSNNQREFGRAPYATYISFAPYDKPQVAFVGVIYDGGHGGYTAPVAKAAYEAYFSKELESKYPNYVKTSESFKKYVLDAPDDNYPGSKKAKEEALKEQKEKQEQNQLFK